MSKFHKLSLLFKTTFCFSGQSILQIHLKMASFMQTSDRDKEKSKNTNQSKQLPKDAQVIISILR